MYRLYTFCVFLASAGALSWEKSVPPFSCTKDHLLLYTLGKTGSSTFQLSLQRSCGLRRFDFLTQPQETYPRAVKVQHSHEAAADFLAKLPSTGALWIVTLLRHPFQRIPSAFFQTHWCLYESGGLEEAMRGFHEKLTRPLNTSSYYQRWMNVTGVDPFQHRFSLERKRMLIKTTYKGRTLNVLVLRVEDIHQWESIVAPYFPNFKLISDNQANNKVYAELYSSFKSHFRFARSEIASVLQTSVELRFYSPREQHREMMHVRRGATSSIPLTGHFGDQARHMCDGRNAQTAARRLRQSNTSQVFAT